MRPENAICHWQTYHITKYEIGMARTSFNKEMAHHFHNIENKSKLQIQSYGKWYQGVHYIKENISSFSKVSQFLQKDQEVFLLIHRETLNFNYWGVHQPGKWQKCPHIHSNDLYE